MPPRQTLLVTGEIYHVVSRGHGGAPIFGRKSDYPQFINTFTYYQNHKPPCRFSKFKTLTINQKNVILESFHFKKDFLVEVLAYCLMPNHFHFLLKQMKDSGVKEFVRLVGNSYAKYFNTKYRRKGTLFESRFKAVRIENDNQLLHVSRYIHLNPYSAYIVRTIEDLPNYPFSSLPQYLTESENICNKELILGQFSSANQYKKFVFNQADYQRKLQDIKHQLLED